MTDSMSIEQAIAAIDECADGTFLMTRDRCAKLRNAGQVIRAALEAGARGAVGERAFERAWLSATDYFTISKAAARCIWNAALAAAPKASEAVPMDRGELIREMNYQLWMNGDGGCEPPDEWKAKCATPQADPAPPVAPDALIGKLRCLGSLLQQLNAQTAAQSVHEAIDALLGLAAQEGAG